jgi:hypothetical protein
MTKRIPMDDPVPRGTVIGERVRDPPLSEAVSTFRRLFRCAGLGMGPTVKMALLATRCRY